MSGGVVSTAEQIRKDLDDATTLLDFYERASKLKNPADRWRCFLLIREAERLLEISKEPKP